TLRENILYPPRRSSDLRPVARGRASDVRRRARRQVRGGDSRRTLRTGERCAGRTDDLPRARLALQPVDAALRSKRWTLCRNDRCRDSGYLPCDDRRAPWAGRARSRLPARRSHSRSRGALCNLPASGGARTDCADHGWTLLDARCARWSRRSDPILQSRCDRTAAAGLVEPSDRVSRAARTEARGMGDSTPMGKIVRRALTACRLRTTDYIQSLFVRAVCIASLSLTAQFVSAASHTVVLSGLGGEPQYEERFRANADEIARIAEGLAEAPGQVVRLVGADATRDAIRRELKALAERAKPDDFVTIVLIG